LRRYILRRKDFSQYPFQYTTDRAGKEQLLEPGYTFTFAIEPPRDDFAFLHIHIRKEFAIEIEQRWNIPQSDLIRLAAKAMESWFVGMPVPDDHFNTRDLLKVDAAWYPHDPDGTPALTLYPYRWEVEVDEPWPFVNGELVNPPSAAEPPSLPLLDNAPRVDFGYTYDVFPGLLIVGYNQMKRKLSSASIDAIVSMLPLADLPARVDYLLVPPELGDTAARHAPTSTVLLIENFMNNPQYNEVVEALRCQAQTK